MRNLHFVTIFNFVCLFLRPNKVAAGSGWLAYNRKATSDTKSYSFRLSLNGVNLIINSKSPKIERMNSLSAETATQTCHALLWLMLVACCSLLVVVVGLLVIKITKQNEF